MHQRRARALIALLITLLAATAATGCLGVDNMDELKARLGAKAELPDPPVAVATAAPLRAEPGEEVRFSGEASVDPANGGLAYHWRFGDGAEASGAVVTHAYDAAGRYAATLTVTDLHGREANNTVTVNVVAVDRPPQARLLITDNSGTETDTTLAGATLTFSAEASNDPEGGALAYAWDFGDGATATGPRVTHRYAEPGVYLAEVTVRDDGGQEDAASRLVVVNYERTFRGTVAQPETDASHAFPLPGEPRRVTLVLTFDAGVGGTQDLNLHLADADGAPVANATTATPPASSGAMEERIALTRDAVAPFAPGEWTARVRLAGGVSVDYTLTVEAEY